MANFTPELAQVSDKKKKKMRRKKHLKSIDVSIFVFIIRQSIRMSEYMDRSHTNQLFRQHTRTLMYMDSIFSLVYWEVQ